MKRSLLKPLTKSSATSRRVYIISGLGGHVLQHRPLAKELLPDWQLIGILYPVFADGDNRCSSIEELASRMRAALDDVEEPIVLLGYSLGGGVAYQIATELHGAGRKVAVVCIDTRLKLLLRKRGRLARGFRNLLYKMPKKLLMRVRPQLKGAPIWRPDDPHLRVFVDESIAANRRYVPPRSDLPFVLIRAAAHGSWRHLIQDVRWPSRTHGWSKVAHLIGVVSGPGDHQTIIRPENQDALRDSLKRAFQMAHAQFDD